MRLSQFNRAAWLVLVLSIVLIGLTTIRVWRVVAQPSDGVRLEYGDSPVIWTHEGVTIVPIEFQPDGLRRNDSVIAVAGQSLETWVRAFFQPTLASAPLQLHQPVAYTVLRDGRILMVDVTLGMFPLGSFLTQQWGNLIFAFPTLVIAGFVFVRRPNERAAQLFLLLTACLGSAGLIWAFGMGITDFAAPFDFWLFRLLSYGTSMLLAGVTLHFALAFPRPHPLLVRYRFIVLFVYTMPYLVLALHLIAMPMGEGQLLEWLGGWAIAGDRINLIYLMLAMLAVISNYRNVQHDVTARQQARWVVFGFSITCGLFLILTLLPKHLAGYPQLDRTLYGLLVLPIPICMGVAILRHHLFDIDLIINRALVYAILSAITMGMYIAIVGALGILFQATNNPITFFLATGVVAVLFQPIRERIQRGVNRLMYGERDDPYAVLSRLGQRLETTLAPNTVLPTIVESIARALKLPYVALDVPTLDGNLQTAAEFRQSITPNDSAQELKFALTHQGEIVGQLRLAPRAPGESFGVADRQLLDDLARRAGAAVYAVGLSHDLQRSRERLVLAREEERRRLRRDLHDDLAPTLATLGLSASTAADLIPANPNRAIALVKELHAEIQATVANIRRLVYDLRPPTLDELGLFAAVHERAAQYSNAPDGLRVSVDAPAELPALPAAVEVAAYRIVQEALANVANHAHARQCSIRFAYSDALEIEIADDGIGLPPNLKPGVGLRSMRERAVELGGSCVIERGAKGGTIVRARLPCCGDFDGTFTHTDRG